jgi:hypothetical protein
LWAKTEESQPVWSLTCWKLIKIQLATFKKMILGKRKICSRFVPHSLTPEQKQKRINCCRDFIKFVEDDADILKRIVTDDNSLCFEYDPETRRQGMEWRSTNRRTNEGSAPEIRPQDDTDSFLRYQRNRSQEFRSPRAPQSTATVI